MKRFFTIFTALLVTTGVYAQSPNKMSYQAVIRNSSGELLTDAQVGMQISILQGSSSGSVVHSEPHTPTTNANGLVSLQIGTGTIDWSNGPFFIKTETDPEGGTNYTITGTSELLTVPYALQAKTAETITGGITETDPVFENSQAANITASDITTLAATSGTNTGDQDLSGLATVTELETALANKVDKVAGKGLSTEDFTTSEQTKLAAITGTNTGDQDISGIATNQQAILDTASQIRADIPDVPSGTQSGEMQYWDGTAWVTIAATENEGATLQMIGGVPTWTGGTPPSVTSTTGKIWMDRNLGASQVATSSTDAAAYGDLYQWGRGTDGHEKRTSTTTTTLSSSDTPGHGDFITTNTSPDDWRSSQNANLWQGVNGVNNPCPSGYRMPTETEWEAERTSWDTNNAAGALASPLKLPMGGDRSGSGDGSLVYVGTVGYYWSSTVSSTYSRALAFSSSSANMLTNYRAGGYAVRCLKD